MPSRRKQQFVSESSDVKILKMNIYTQRYTQNTHTHTYAGEFIFSKLAYVLLYS